MRHQWWNFPFGASKLVRFKSQVYLTLRWILYTSRVAGIHNHIRKTSEYLCDSVGISLYRYCHLASIFILFEGISPPVTSSRPFKRKEFLCSQRLETPSADCNYGFDVWRSEFFCSWISVPSDRVILHGPNRFSFEFRQGFRCRIANVQSIDT